MIGFILVAIGAIAVLAVIVGVLDAAGRPEARRRAAERRSQWEARQPEWHGPTPAGRYDDGWDDD